MIAKRTLEPKRAAQANHINSCMMQLTISFSGNCAKLTGTMSKRRIKIQEGMREVIAGIDPLPLPRRRTSAEVENHPEVTLGALASVVHQMIAKVLVGD